MPAGRPSAKTPELIFAICEKLAGGTPLKKICEEDGMPSFQTVWRWENEDEEFRELSTRARRHGTHFLADECITISDEDVEDSVDVQRNRLRVDTRLRLIGKWNRKDYGEKQEVAHSGEVTSNVNLSSLTPEQLEAIASINLAGE